MNTAAGVIGGLVVGAAIGYGGATMLKGAHLRGGSLGGGDDAVVLELDGSKYKESDLPADVRSSLYEAKEEAHERASGIISQFALQFALAKDKDKNAKPDSLPGFDQLLDAPAPSDAEMQALFEANKARLPPNTSFEQIKPEIERYVKNQKLSEQLRAKNDEFRAKNRIAVLLPSPVAPQVQLVLDAYPVKGAPGSANTLVEVADYLCPHCQASQPEVEDMVKELGSKLKFIPVSYSLKPDGLSGALARGAYCAKQQGDDAFWKYHGTAFATGKAKGWKTSDPDSKEPVLEVAGAAGLDKAKLEACLGSPEAQNFVKVTSDNMHKAGVSGTPTFFLNGRKLPMTGGKSIKDSVLSSIQASSH